MAAALPDHKPASPVRRCHEYRWSGYDPLPEGVGVLLRESTHDLRHYSRCATTINDTNSHPSRNTKTVLRRCEGPGSLAPIVLATKPFGEPWQEGTWPRRHARNAIHYVCDNPDDVHSHKNLMLEHRGANEDAQIGSFRIPLCKRCQDDELEKFARAQDDSDVLDDTEWEERYFPCVCKRNVQERVLCYGCRGDALRRLAINSATRKREMRSDRWDDALGVKLRGPRRALRDRCRCGRATTFYRTERGRAYVRVMYCAGCNGTVVL